MEKYICKICEKEYKNMNVLSTHVTKYHPEINSREYALKYYYDGIEPVCKCGCGEKTRHKNITKFAEYKSGHNSNLDSNPFKDFSKQKLYCEIKKEKYGDPYYSNREQIIKTTKKRYGGMGFSSQEILNKSRKTKQKRYGNPDYTNHDKSVETNLKKYGVKSNFQLESNKEKSRRTSLKKYGVDHPAKLYTGKTFDEIFGKKRSSKIRLDLRLNSIRHWQKRTGQRYPNYNLKACKYFNILIEQTGTHIQHAENGGEYHISELGYWVDGYDKKNNIVYEYDEKYHFDINGELKTKDKRRQKEIEEFLGCKFIRIKEGENMLNENIKNIKIGEHNGR